MATKRYKRKRVQTRKSRKSRNSKTRRYKKGGQQLWRLGDPKATHPGLRGGKWNADYYKLGANHDYKYAPCSLTYASIRAAANMPDHGYKIKN